MKKHTHIYILSIFSFALIMSCGTGDIAIQGDGYDRSTILKNMTENIIIPSYDQFEDDLNKLNTSTNEFILNPNESNLTDLRKEWINTYISFQNIEMFNIGKAEEIYFHKRMNTYPCNTTIINNNIENMMHDFSADNFSNYSSQGLPTLDYLLYGLGGDSSSVINYYIDTTGYKHREYLNIIVNEMVNNTNQVIDYWQNNESQFISSSGNTSTSSLNMITNDFIFYYEKGLRANKIGIPAGVYSSNVLPNNTEAYYKSDISKDLALEALDACKRFFNGESFLDGSTGESLNSYLIYLDLGNGLNNDILLSFENSRDKLNGLDNNFKDQINSNNIKMLECFDALQAGVVLLKTDMLSNLNINVDYVDADGD